MMNDIQAVIFDLDGTLIDTEKYYRICWPQAAKHFGYEMTDEQALILRSLGRPYAKEQFRQWYGEHFDYESVRAYRKELMEKCLADNGIEIKPGAVELLTFLREHQITTALATATDQERAKRYLKQIGLYEYFDRIVCADMVENGKPAPDIYRYACKQLGKQPQQCIAVEDSPNGAKSAYEAGCKVVFVADQTMADKTLAPLLVASVDSLKDICSLLKR